MSTLKKWLRKKLPWGKKDTPTPHIPDPLPFLPFERPSILTPSPSRDALVSSMDSYGYFQLLPYEIRRPILIEALGGRTLHMDLAYKTRGVRDNDGKWIINDDGTSPQGTHPTWGYAEGIDVVFATNTIHMENYDLLRNLPRILLPQRLRVIESLEISWTFRSSVGIRNHKPLEVLWKEPTAKDSVLHEMCRIVPEQFPHLRRLDIHLLCDISEPYPRHIEDSGGLERVILGPIEDMIRVLGPGPEDQVCLGVPSLLQWLDNVEPTTASPILCMITKSVYAGRGNVLNSAASAATLAYVVYSIGLGRRGQTLGTRAAGAEGRIADTIPRTLWEVSEVTVDGAGADSLCGGGGIEGKEESVRELHLNSWRDLCVQ
ncbi:hypothetical protein V500_03100 [Pseudogymnoascus sp. VKM F-4518 (FW-2643)]|nr:hypothetical protein V500_03100 [Pseudogymnoascus sp. VKM F-4518 (FW-2643)]